MKGFIQHIIIFTLILLVLGIVLDIIISKNLRKSNSYSAGEYTVWNDIFDKKIHHDILVYGSSRAWVHFSPTIIEAALGKTVYNMGLDGQNFQTQYIRHRKILDSHTPKLIIFSLDVFTLERDTNIYNVEQFLPYMPDIDIFSYTAENNGFTFFDYWLPAIRYAGRKDEINLAYKLCITDTIQKPYRYNGYKPVVAYWNKQVETNILKKKHTRVTINESIRTLFEACIAECLQNNIQVMLVYSPEHIMGQKHIQNRDSIINIYANISQKYSIPLYNFSNDTMCYSTQYFYNASHLNKDGSELFSKKTASIIQKSQVFK